MKNVKPKPVDNRLQITQFMLSPKFAPKDWRKLHFTASKLNDKSNTHPGKQGVEAMDLLPFSDISVILSDTFQCELLHQVDLIRFLQMGSLKKKKEKQKTAAVKMSD